MCGHPRSLTREQVQQAAEHHHLAAGRHEGVGLLALDDRKLPVQLPHVGVLPAARAIPSHLAHTVEGPQSIIQSNNHKRHPINQHEPTTNTTIIKTINSIISEARDND